MRGKAFSVALSAVACALATVLMSLAINIPMLMLTGYVFASVALMLPLAKDFRTGGFLAYLATCLLCLAFGGIAYFYRLFPFVAFFGLHPLVNSLQRRFKIKNAVAVPVKTVWFDGMLCCALWLLFSFNVDIQLPFGIAGGWLYLIAVVAGSVIFPFYDWVMVRFQKFGDGYIRRIERGKGTPASGPGAPSNGAGMPPAGIDPFEDESSSPAEKADREGEKRETELREGEKEKIRIRTDRQSRASEKIGERICRKKCV